MLLLLFFFKSIDTNHLVIDNGIYLEANIIDDVLVLEAVLVFDI